MANNIQCNNLLCVYNIMEKYCTYMEITLTMINEDLDNAQVGQLVCNNFRLSTPKGSDHGY